MRSVLCEPWLSLFLHSGTSWGAILRTNRDIEITLTLF